jgi:hypothetical protein
MMQAPAFPPTRPAVRAARLACHVCLASLGVSARASADDHVPLVLEYSAPPACPGADRFLDEIAARTSRARPAKPDERATTLTVVIKDVAGGDKGTLKLQAADGATSARQVSAADCEQVVSALALMTALAIDPNAVTDPVAVTKPPTQKPSEPPAPKPAPASEPKAPPPKPEPSRARFEVGAAFAMLAGATPEPLFMARPFVELGTAGPSPWSRALRISAAYGRRTVIAQEGGAEYTLLTGRIEGCPARFRAMPALQLSPCVAIDAGRLEAVGVGVTPVQSAKAPWVAPGLVARVEWEIANLLVVEVSGEILFPLVRDRFFVNSDTTLYRTSPVAGGAAAGLGVRFP